MKKALLLFTIIIFAFSMCGCFVVIAGTAAGVGTAVWLSDKLTQEFNAPYDRTIDAAEAALRSLKLEITKKTREAEVTQLRGKYSDGKEIWIDIRKITENSTKVEIRVGALSPDKAASEKILKRIKVYL